MRFPEQAKSEWDYTSSNGEGRAEGRHEKKKEARAEGRAEWRAEGRRWYFCPLEMR